MEEGHEMCVEWLFDVIVTQWCVAVLWWNTWI